MEQRWKSVVKLIIYFVLLIAIYFLANHFYFPKLQPYAGFMWTILYFVITFSFNETRSILKKVTDFKPLTSWKTYCFIIVAVMVPFLLLKFMVTFEFGLSKEVIFRVKYSLMEYKTISHIIHGTILAPIWEEYFFRGVLLWELLKFMNKYWAIGLTSIIFAWFHHGYELQVFGFAIMLGILSYKYKSVIPGILAHSLWNLYIGKLFVFIPL